MELYRAVTAISEAKARDLAWVDFSKNPRDLAGDFIDQLSLVRDQLAAVKRTLNSELEPEPEPEPEPCRTRSVHRYPSNRADASRIFCRSSQM
jgi:hypothetical protein